MGKMTKSERLKLWLDRLARFSQSNLRVAEFCEAEGISIASYYQWKRRLWPRVLIEKQTKNQHQRPFTELIVGSSVTSGSTVHSQAEVSVQAQIDTQAPSQAQAFLPGDIALTLGTHPEIVALIVDRLLQHANNSPEGASSC